MLIGKTRANSGIHYCFFVLFHHNFHRNHAIVFLSTCLKSFHETAIPSTPSPPSLCFFLLLKSNNAHRINDECKGQGEPK